MNPADVEGPCTDCEDTGVTIQMERTCTCDAGTALSAQAPMPAASAEPVAWMYETKGGGYKNARIERLDASCDGRNPDKWEETPLYTASPVQAPMPGEVGELVERLEAGVERTGLHDDNSTELYDVDQAAQDMYEAAALIQTLQREVDLERAKFADLAEHERQAREMLTAAQRVKDEAVGLLRPLVKALADADEDGLTEQAEPMIAARAFLSQYGGKHG